MTQLPAYLQSAPAKKLNEAALAGIGSALPPHISIRGNTFTLVDATGATQAAGPTLDICIADLSDVMCKQFYAEDWKPDSKDPPVCWSANGIGPSREAIEPQSITCAACPNNVRGSDVSKLSGVAIKACRDEKWLAVLIPQIPQVKFQLRLTPGSFKTWQSYVKQCEGNQTEISNVLTRVTFQPGVNGVLLFQPVAYIDENTALARNAGYAEKAFDILVGRTDMPRQGALPAPAAAPVQQINAPQAQAAQQVQQPAPFGAQPAATPSMQTAQSFQASPAQSATAASPSNPAPTTRRRRTKAEIEAANAAQQPQGQPAAPQPGFQPQPAAPIAPFRPQAAQEVIPPGQGQAPGFMAANPTPAFNGAAPVAPSPGHQFGIASGVAPNAELQTALDGLFKK